MSRFFGSMALVGAFLLVLGGADAQDGKKKRGERGGRGGLFGGNIEEVFKKLDTNKDGKLTKEEFTKIAPEGRGGEFIGRLFDRIAGDSGDITLEQLKKGLESRGGDRGKRPGPRGKGGKKGPDA